MTSPVAHIAPWHAEFTALRRDLHMHPELGFEEHRTAKIVCERLASFGIEHHSGIGKTGVVAVIRGRSDDTLKVAGKRIGPAEVESAAVAHPAVQEAAQTQSAPASEGEPKPEEDKKKLILGTDETEKGPISVDAGIMNYVEKDRIIHFEKDVKIVTSSTKIVSEKADFFLKQNTSDFDRLYAQGKVEIQHEGLFSALPSLYSIDK
jgi:acyl-CoA synthetase (AMP-forming)/AMP-acid ligase II